MDTQIIKIRPQWPHSKDDIWNKTFNHLDEQDCKERQTIRAGLLRLPSWSYAAAAVFVAVVMVSQLYTVHEEAARGEQTTARLPDNSLVTLNADSKLSYKPLMWFLSRRVELAGEACFEVQKGSRFSVQSGRNRVMALGTVFNVYARQEAYRVACVTGMVEVAYDKQEKIILRSGMQVACRIQKQLVDTTLSTVSAIGWIQGRLDFVETPLTEVLAEIERQYDIRITSDGELNHLYTGHFVKTDNLENILSVIGTPFGVKFSISK